MDKMRISSTLMHKTGVARFTAAGVALLPFLLPANVSAATVKVCTSTGDACTKFIDKYVTPVITLLSISIGVFAVISYILAAIQYSSAGDDPGAVSKAKDRAFKTTIGLLGYIFFFSLLNYIVPGGLF